VVASCAARRCPTPIRDRILGEVGTVLQDQEDTSAADGQPSPPSATEFDSEFATGGGSPGLRRVWQQASPDLPPEIEPYSFVSVALLGHLADALALSPGETLVDLGCGRGGPGLWLAQSRGAVLIGVDFSAVAVQQAADRAALFGLANRARFVVGDLASTGLADGAADAVVSIDALHFAADPTAAAREALRLLRPGGRLVLTNWQARSPADPQLPSRMHIDWTETLGSAGFAEVRVESRPEWHDLFTRVFQVALDLGDPGEDVGLASLQDEARQVLPKADLVDRVVGTATRPDRQVAVDGIGL
jgi:ubiquinone/menaquinone biosynthesis C-methylase UbiE